MSFVSFPSSPDVSLDLVSGNIRTLGKTKLIVSLGTIHLEYIIKYGQKVALLSCSLVFYRNYRMGNRHPEKEDQRPARYSARALLSIEAVVTKYQYLDILTRDEVVVT